LINKKVQSYNLNSIKIPLSFLIPEVSAYMAQRLQLHRKF